MAIQNIIHKKKLCNKLNLNIINSLQKMRRAVFYFGAEQNGGKTLQKNLAYF